MSKLDLNTLCNPQFLLPAIGTREPLCVHLAVAAEVLDTLPGNLHEVADAPRDESLMGELPILDLATLGLTAQR